MDRGAWRAAVHEVTKSRYDLETERKKSRLTMRVRAGSQSDKLQYKWYRGAVEKRTGLEVRTLRFVSALSLTRYTNMGAIFPFWDSSFLIHKMKGLELDIQAFCHFPLYISG